MNIIGIDVGKSFSTFAILQDNKIVKTGRFMKDTKPIEDLIRDHSIGYAGIDAPLSFPKESSLRKSERRLLKMGIRLFPSGANFFREIVEEGIRLSQLLRENKVVVYEVYPYATRKILNIAPKSKKFLREGLSKIKTELRFYVEFDLSVLDHNVVDAIISALSVKLFLEGKGDLLEGEILIPKL